MDGNLSVDSSHDDVDNKNDESDRDTRSTSKDDHSQSLRTPHTPSMPPVAARYEQPAPKSPRPAANLVSRHSNGTVRDQSRAATAGDASVASSGARDLAAATRRSLVSNIIQDLFFYIIFLILFVVAIMLRSPQSLPSEWRLTLQSRFAPTEQQLVNHDAMPFDDINSREDVWSYLKLTLAPALVPDPASPLSNAPLFLRSVLVGSIRLWQVRVHKESCPSHLNVIMSNLGGAQVTCFPESLTAGTTSQDSYGGPDNSLFEWTGPPQKSVNMWLVAPDSQYGSGGGFSQFLSTNLTTSTALLSYLESNDWIDLQTRAVFVDFALHNPTERLFCMVRLLFQTPAYGGVQAISSFRVAAVMMYSTPSDIVAAVFEGLFIVAYLRMLRATISEIRRSGRSFFTSVWGIIDLLNSIIFAMIIILSVITRSCASSLYSRIDTDAYVNWQNYGYMSNQLKNLGAFNAVLSWIRVRPHMFAAGTPGSDTGRLNQLLKYLRLSARLSMLEKVFVNVKSELFAWATLFLVIFSSFVQAFYMGFHESVSDYQSLGMAIMTLFKGAFGDLVVTELQAENQILGPIFFMAYIFVMFFVMLNMFLASVAMRPGNTQRCPWN